MLLVFRYTSWVVILRMYVRLLAIVLLLMAVPASAQTPRTHEDMKRAVSVKRFPDGRVIASSAAFAVVERTTRYANGGNGSRSVSVMIEAWPDKPVEIYFLASSVFAVLETEKQSRDDAADPEKVVDAYIGAPWTKTVGRVLENTVTCAGVGSWCHQNRHRRIDLSQQMVREIVADETRKSISMNLETARAGWTIPRSHLIATLDAVGLLKAFQ